MNKTVVIAIAVTILVAAKTAAQCPTLGQNATFTSADCQPGSNPCALCPGDQYTLTPTGTNLQAGDCINWYISDMPNFNPYNGQGTLLGCSQLSSPPPDPCNPNPIFLGIMVNACGTEENNEFFGMWSGGGFNVSDLDVSYSDASNNGCGWQTPSPALQAAFDNECPGAVYVGAGQTIPPNVPVVVFTSSDADFDYNFGGLCATNGTVYVLQSDCSHATDVFPNTGAGSVTTTVSIGCWSDDITYNLNQIANVNGAFVAELPILGTIYGQAGCAWPNFPGLPGTDPTVNIAPLDITVAADQCNNGPYYIVGIYDPLPTGCPQTFTNYLQYDVPCPSPVLGTTELCSSVTNYSLIALQDPDVPAGAWSGDGVTGTTFNATGLSGPVALTFTPTSPCGTPATTFITVNENATAVIDPVAPVCSGGSTNLVVNFTGTSAWTFNLLANGSLIGNMTAGETPFSIPVNPVSNTNYTIQGLVDDAGCTGPNTSRLVTVSNTSTSATLTLVGSDSICAGSSTNFSIDFTGGVPPYDFTYAINGVAQPQVLNISQNPYIFPVTITTNSIVSLVDLTDDNGCSGSVSGSGAVTALASPTASLLSDTISICTGATDTLVFKLTGIAPFTFVYKVNNVNQPPITTSNTTYKLAVTPTASPTVYTLASVSDSICTGTVSGIFRIILIPSPMAVLSGTDTICSGQPADLKIDFTGTGPFTVNYTGNTVPQPIIQTSTDPYIFQVNPTQTTTYILTALDGNGCPGTVSGSGIITVPPAPTAVISGGGQICQNGSGTTVTINFTGVAPYTFVYSINNVNQSSITTSQNPYTFSVNPLVGTGYRLVSFHDAICDGTVSGIAQVFVFVPASATLSGDATFCDSAMTTIMVDFNGSGPFTIEYTINNVLQPPFFTSDDPLFIPINVNSTTTYKLVNVESPGCTGTPAGTATITVNYPPSYANVALNCNALQNNYTVTFDAVNATLPLTLVSGSGTFTGSTFTSNPIPQGTGYSFQFHDAHNCGDITVSGPSTCNCTTKAGTMNLTPLNACASQTVTAIHNGGHINDGDDVLMFMLHSNPAQPFGTIYGWSATPTFAIQAGMSPGTTYYISPIAGNLDGMGQVDLMDPCLSVSLGTPVVFHDVPTADIGISSKDVCIGDSLIIPVALTGSPNFSIIPQFGSNVQPAIAGITGGTYNLTVFPTQDMTVTVNNIADQFCPMGDTAGAVSIHVLTPPQFGQDTVACDYLTGTYTVSFPVTGTPPYNLSSMLASFNGTSFTSQPIPFGTLYFTFLTDGNNCGQDTLSGLGVCDCLSDAGTMSQTQVNACQGTQLTVPAAMGAVVEPGDVLMYILHSTPGNPTGSIFAWSATPNFTFNPPMAPNTIYYVSAIVGNPDGNGLVDLNDQCLSVATGTPVMWYPVPTATLTTGTFNICPGGSQSLLVSLTGTPNYTLTYTSNSTPFNVTSTQNLFSIFAQLQQTAILTLTALTDAHGCAGTVSGQAQVIVHQLPKASVVTPTCNLNDLTYTVAFDVTSGDTATMNVANLPGTYDPVTGHFVSNPIPSGQPYSFTLTDSWHCGMYTVTDSVDCTCITSAGTMAGGNIVLCPGQTASATPATGFTLEMGDTLIYLLVSSTSPTNWTVLASNSTPTFQFNAASMAYGTTYYIVAAAGNSTPTGINFSDPCFVSVPGPTVMWRAPVTATLTGTATICNGSSANLSVAFSGTGPYSLTYNDGGTNQVVSNITTNPYTLTVSPTSSKTYNLVGVSGAGGCQGSVSGTAMVQVNQLPTAVNIVEKCDLATETYILTFDISNGASPNSIYSVIGMQGSIFDTTFTSLSNPGTQPYLITITDNIGCSSTVSGQPACVCTSSAGTLSNAQDACLPAGQVSAQSNANSSPDTNDIVHYFLCSDPTMLPAGILAESANPTFGFQTGMTAETTYYIVIGVGNPLTNGMLDLADPCLSFSAGIPVVFHNVPTAAISGNVTACPGDDAAFAIQFTGNSPFKFVYAIDGVSQPEQTSVSNAISVTASNVVSDAIFTLVSVSDANCTGTVSGQATLTVLPHPTGDILSSQTICLGDTTTLTLNLTGATIFDLTINSQTGVPVTLVGIPNGLSFKVSPTTTTTYSISNLSGHGNSCPADIGPDAVITVDHVTTSLTTTDYNGFNISCPNGDDGAITANPLTGTPPFTGVWSNGQSGLALQNLTTGTYTVVVTDQFGCTAIDSVAMVEPPELGITTEATGPICFGDPTGFINVTQITGGAGPFNLLLDGAPKGPIDALPASLIRLTSGTYSVGIEDANGCISDVSVEVPTPIQLVVNLGPDTLISFGDSLLLTAVHNATQLDTFFWSPTDYLQTPNAIVSWTRPPQSLRYSIYITDDNGCKASDEILVLVRKDARVYVPNAFAPGSSNANNVVSVWAGAEVKQVRFFRIFDRWGEMVFQQEKFAPNDPQLGWNGFFRGSLVDPAVFVYVLEVEYINGETEIFKGDITVVR